MVATTRTLDELQTHGYAVLRDAVPADAIDAALRHIHRDIVHSGLPVEWTSQWLWSAHWFPHLKWDPPILGLLESLPPELVTGEKCDPQILLQIPHEGDDVELTPHVDQEPEWANGRRYARIVGVALSPSTKANGCLHAWTFDGDGTPEPVELGTGDVVVMHPDLRHAGGVNHTGSLRYAVYFRFLPDR